jgi:hypothetical protein
MHITLLIIVMLINVDNVTFLYIFVYINKNNNYEKRRINKQSKTINKR